MPTRVKLLNQTMILLIGDVDWIGHAGEGLPLRLMVGWRVGKVERRTVRRRIDLSILGYLMLSF